MISKNLQHCHKVTVNKSDEGKKHDNQKRKHHKNYVMYKLMATFCLC